MVNVFLDGEQNITCSGTVLMDYGQMFICPVVVQHIVVGLFL